jgi:hypothetical protein
MTAFLASFSLFIIFEIKVLFNFVEFTMDMLNSTKLNNTLISNIINKLNEARKAVIDGNTNH